MPLPLQKACQELAKIDPTFRGSLQHASERMDRVGLLSLRNLESGHTEACEVKVRTMNEILRVFRRCKSISVKDFKARSPRKPKSVSAASPARTGTRGKSKPQPSASLQRHHGQTIPSPHAIPPDPRYG